MSISLDAASLGSAGNQFFYAILVLVGVSMTFKRPIEILLIGSFGCTFVSSTANVPLFPLTTIEFGVIVLTALSSFIHSGKLSGVRLITSGITLVFGYIMVRLLQANSLQYAAPLAVCGAIALLAEQNATQFVLRAPYVLSKIAIVFPMISLWWSPRGLILGERFDGISGNPNRMVLGLLVLLPFLVPTRRARLLENSLKICSILILFVEVGFSGSVQGLSGLLLIFAIYASVGSAADSRSSSSRVVRFVARASLGVGLAFAFLNSYSYLLVKFDETRTSVSGRSDIWGVGLARLQEFPLFGVGVFRVTRDVAIERSAHSTALALLLVGGLALLLLSVPLVKAYLSGLVSLVKAHPELFASLSVLTLLSFVQGLELAYWFWCMIGVAVGISRRSHSPSPSVNRV